MVIKTSVLSSRYIAWYDFQLKIYVIDIWCAYAYAINSLWDWSVNVEAIITIDNLEYWLNIQWMSFGSSFSRQYF